MQDSELRSARVAVAAIFFVNGAAMASWFVRIPAVQGGLGLSAGLLGIVLLCVATGALITMPATGYLVRRFGATTMMRATAPLLCLGLALPALASNPLLLGLAGIVLGAGHGSLDVAMNARASELEQDYGRPIMSSFHALFSIGGLTGSAAGGVLASLSVGAATHLILVAAVLMVCAAASYPLMAGGGARPRAEAETVSDAGPAFSLPTAAVAALGLVGFCVLFGEGAMADWSAVYLREAVGTGEGLAAAGYAAFSTTMAAGRLTGDRFTELLGAATLARLGGALAAFGLAVCLLFQSPWLALTGFGVVGLGFSTVFPLALSAAGRTRKMPPAAAIAAVASCGYAGFLVGPPIIGFTAELTNLRVALASVLVLSTIVAVLGGTVEQKSARALEEKEGQ